MQLIFAVIQTADSGRVVAALTRAGLRVTRLASRGGFLREVSATLLLGVDEARSEEALSIIQKFTRKRTKRLQRSDLIVPPRDLAAGSGWVEVQIGGAVVFILSLDQLIHM